MGDLAREGMVTSVDLKAGTARVQFAAELETGDLPWLAPRMGNTRLWAPPSVGEQVLVICPEADGARGIIIGSLASDTRPNPADHEGLHIAFEDGAIIAYDAKSHYLTASLPGGSTIDVKADTIFLHGNVHVDGDIDVTGKITAGDDVIGAGKSLKSHVHKGVQAGSANSGPPQ